MPSPALRNGPCFKSPDRIRANWTQTWRSGEVFIEESPGARNRTLPPSRSRALTSNPLLRYASVRTLGFALCLLGCRSLTVAAPKDRCLRSRQASKGSMSSLKAFPVASGWKMLCLVSMKVHSYSWAKRRSPKRIFCICRNFGLILSHSWAVTRIFTHWSAERGPSMAPLVASAHSA